MDPAAKRALRTIRQCIVGERFRVTQHFTQRMDERGLFWPDVLAVLDDPAGMKDGGLDEAGRDKWLIRGLIAVDSGGGGLEAELVCAIGREADGAYTVFITLYWLED